MSADVAIHPFFTSLKNGKSVDGCHNILWPMDSLVEVFRPKQAAHFTSPKNGKSVDGSHNSVGPMDSRKGQGELWMSQPLGNLFFIQLNFPRMLAVFASCPAFVFFRPKQLVSFTSWGFGKSANGSHDILGPMDALVEVLNPLPDLIHVYFVTNGEVR